MALCADVGVPPLRLTQQVQLAQLHFRLTQVYKDSIPDTLYEITKSRFQDLPPQAMERLMQQAQNQSYIVFVSERTNKRHHQNWLRVQVSGLWRRKLMFFKSPTQAPGRIPAYVQYNTRDLERANLYKPAPYLEHCIVLNKRHHHHKHTPRTRHRFDQTQSAGMAPVYPHSPTFLGQESPTGVPTQTLRILPPATGIWP